MSKFALVYRSTSEVHREITGSPEKAEQSMRKWRAWFREMTDNGQLEDIGIPLERVGKVVGGRKKMVTDGPYAEAVEQLGGVYVIEAPDLDVVLELLTVLPPYDIQVSPAIDPS